MGETLGAAVIRCSRHVGSSLLSAQKHFPSTAGAFYCAKLLSNKFFQRLGMMWKHTALSLCLTVWLPERKKTQQKQKATPWDEQEVQLTRATQLRQCSITGKPAAGVKILGADVREADGSCLCHGGQAGSGSVLLLAQET